MMEAWPILEDARAVDSRVDTIEAGRLVSVVVPTFRRRGLLERAVRSALAQDYVTLEILVVGDACPELEPDAFGDEPRVQVYNLSANQGGGGAAARNFALSVAHGELVAYLDDDNTWHPDHLSSIARRMGETGAAFGFSSLQVEGRDLGFDAPRFQGIDTSCIVHERRLIAAHGAWKSREEAGYAHDWELVERWLRAGEPWVATGRPTLVYTAATSGQAAFLRGRGRRPG